MNVPLAVSRRLAARLAPVVALVALAAGVVSALHHHGPDRTHDQCAVCSHGNAPAIASISAAVPIVPRVHVALCESPPDAPRPQRADSAAHSRAPPLA